MTPAPQPRKHLVHIRINGSGFMYARPDGQNAATIVVQKGDHVSWRCDHGNYSVLFKADSPFVEVGFTPAGGLKPLRLSSSGAPDPITTRSPFRSTAASLSTTRSLSWATELKTIWFDSIPRSAHHRAEQPRIAERNIIVAGKSESLAVRSIHPPGLPVP